MLFQGMEYLLWKSIKRSNASFSYYHKRKVKKEEIIAPNEMICRVCTLPADIPFSAKISDDITSINILTALRVVANILVSDTDEYPKYICKICFDQLKIALNFKRKCEASDYTFRQSSLKRPVSLYTSGTMVYHDFGLILQKMREKQFNQRTIKVKNETDETNEDMTPNFTKGANLKANLPIKKIKSVLKNVKNETNEDMAPNFTKGANLKANLPTKRIKSVLKNRCKQCDLTFDSKELLFEHRRKRSCVYHPCTLCGKLVSNLPRHQKDIHLRKQNYTCHICGKITKSSATLRNHLFVHTEKGFSCGLCPYKGKRKSYLALHMRTHTGERPYLCSACPAKFVNPSNLRKHQLTHSIKKFECNKCKKQFRLQKSLQEHYDAAHLNMRYRCSICGRDLWTRRKLLSHELSVHKREKHKLYEEIQKVVVSERNH